MSYSPISLSGPPQYHVDGVPADGYVLKAYQATTTTILQMATDSSAGTLVNDMLLNSAGYPEVSTNIVVPHINVNYKLSLYPSQAAADSNTGATWTIDNLAPTAITTSITDSVSTVPNLRNYTGSAINIILQGNAAAGDGLGGIFYKVSGAAAATYTDDGVDTIVPTGGDGSEAWLRLSETLTSPTLTSPTLVSAVLGTPASGTLTNCTGLPATGLVAYLTDTLSPTGDNTKDFGRLCRITLNAQNDQVTLKAKVSYHSDRNYAEFIIGAKQVAALNNDPECYISCITLDDNDTGGAKLSRILVSSLVAFYTISATESYIDVYFNDSFADDLVYGYQFGMVDIVGTAGFTAISAETPIAALSWDATSQSYLQGVVVYDEEITLDNQFTGGTVQFKAVQGNGGYWCSLSILTDITNASATSALSSALIQSAYRPGITQSNTVTPGTFTYRLSINAAGTIQFTYLNTSDGTGASLTGTSGLVPSLIYFAAD